MTKIPYYHVDAFASGPFAGNQAAVMVLEQWLPDDVLQAIGEENNFAETAFLVRDDSGDDGAGSSDQADWQLRWFTPTTEIRLCGHATLASGHVLLSRYGAEQIGGAEQVRFRTRKAGVLKVCRDETGYQLSLPAIETQQGTWPEAEALLGARPCEIWRNADRYNIFLFENAAQIAALDPDLRGLAALGDDQFICTAAGQDTDVLSRVFVPGGGVDEDSFTGSAHAVLTPFWARRLKRDTFTAYQASRRGGHAICRLDGNRVWLGGACATVIEGTFYLTG